MSDETTTTEEAPAVAEVAPVTEAAPVPEHASQTLVLAQNLDHDRVFYPAGSKVSGSVFTAEQFAQLRDEGVLKFEHEVAKAEDVARQLAEKAAALAGAQSEIAALRAQLEAAQKAGSKSR